MKREITITILAEDILLDNYTNSSECPITKALHRAGYTELKDTGNIKGELDGEYISIHHRENESYEALLLKMFGMINSFTSNIHQAVFTSKGNDLFIPEAIPVEDFTHTIVF